MKEQRKVRVIVGKYVNSERTARKQLLKKLGITNKRFRRMNKAARRTGEAYFFQYDAEKKIYTGKKSE
jgi:hypothetical protein